MPKRWRIAPHDAQGVRALERSAGISAVVAQLLLARGVTDPQVAREFLDPRLSNLRDPDLLPGCTSAAAYIMQAVADRRPIVVYGDYDVDGMTGTAVLLLCLRMLGATVGSYVPHRLEEGYGLHVDALRTIAEGGAKLVITVDCGIASAEQARAAAELSLELIVTDHHQPGAELPRAKAICHPGLPGQGYPFSGLCGAGVAFKLAWAICQQASQSKKVSEGMKSFLIQALGLVALGTVADCVPLLDENRALVRHGLVSLRQRPTPGIAALIRVCGFEEKAELTCEDIAFGIAPRLNAAGRLGQAALAVELLTTESVQRATALAEYLHELNGSRDSLERSIYLAANKQVQEQFDGANDAALVLAERGWHAGVIGIVASRLVDKFHCPVALVAMDELGAKPGTGSARSVAGFDLHAALESCREHLVSYGGHAAAAGLKIEDAKLPAFRESFCEHAATELVSHERIPELRIDAEVPFSALTRISVQQLERLSPFGQGNARPVFCASNVSLIEPPRLIGGGQRHLSLKLVQHGIKFRAVAFGAAEWADELLGSGGPIAVAFRPVINEYRGRSAVELQLCDWQPAATPVAACG